MMTKHVFNEIESNDLTVNEYQTIVAERSRLEGLPRSEEEASNVSANGMPDQSWCYCCTDYEAHSDKLCPE